MSAGGSSAVVNLCPRARPRPPAVHGGRRRHCLEFRGCVRLPSWVDFVALPWARHFSMRTRFTRSPNGYLLPGSCALLCLLTSPIPLTSLLGRGGPVDRRLASSAGPSRFGIVCGSLDIAGRCCFVLHPARRLQDLCGSRITVPRWKAHQGILGLTPGGAMTVPSVPAADDSPCVAVGEAEGARPSTTLGAPGQESLRCRTTLRPPPR